MWVISILRSLYTCAFFKKKSFKKVFQALWFISLFLTASLNGALFASNGAFTRQIPIEILPGTGGVQPSLALSYSSDSSYGIAGAGWQISGATSISGKIIAGQMTWFGPGGKMVQTPLGYRYEKENGVLVKKISDTQWEELYPDGKKVYYLHSFGNTYLLQRVEDLNELAYEVSYYLPANSSMPYLRQIVYTIHPALTLCKRVYFEYEDRTDKRITYVSGVTKTLNYRLSAILVETEVSCASPENGGQAVRRYRFSYNTSGPVSLSRLSKVEVSDSTLSNYLTLESYSYPDFSTYSRLNSMVSAPGPGSAEQIPIFDYSKGVTSLVSKGQFIDVNGDGRVDQVIGYKLGTTEVLSTYINTGSGGVLDAGYELPYPMMHYNSDGKLTRYGGVFVDLNNDGLVDYTYADDNDGIPANLARSTWMNNGSFWDSTGAYLLPEALVKNNYATDTPVKRGAFADLNGDGYQDMVISYYIYGQYYQKAYINNRSGGFNETAAYRLPQVLYNYSAGPGVQAEVGKLLDLNGDGLLDFTCSYRNPVGSKCKAVWINTGSGWQRDTNYNPPDLYVDYIRGWDKPLVKGTFADLNGDGLVDWLSSYRTSKGVLIRGTYMNNGVTWTGNGAYGLPDAYMDYSIDEVKLDDYCDGAVAQGDFADLTACRNHFFNEAYSYGRPMGRLVDINGDGLVDWVQSYRWGYNGLMFRKIYHNNGRSFQDAGQHLPELLNYFMEDASRPFLYRAVQNGVFADFNSDGVQDWIYSYQTYGAGKLVGYYPSRVSTGETSPYKITSVTTTIGGTMDVEYTDALDLNGWIAIQYSPASHVPDLAARQVVSRITTGDGNGQSSSVSYEYSNARTYAGEIADRQSLGLYSVKKTNDQTGEYTIKYFNQGYENLFLAGLVFREETWIGMKVLSRKYTYYETWGFTDSSGVSLGTTIVRPRNALLAGGGPATIEYTYDLMNGVLTSKVETDVHYVGNKFLSAMMVSKRVVRNYGLATHTPVEMIKTITFGTNDEANNIMGRPVTITEYVDGAQLSLVTNTYDPAKPWRLISRTDWYNDGSDFVTQFAYDQFGNVTEIIPPKGHAMKIAFDPHYALYPLVESHEDFHSIKEVDFFGNITATYRYTGSQVPTPGATPPTGAVKTSRITYDDRGRKTSVFDTKNVRRKNWVYVDSDLGQVGAQHRITTVNNGTGYMVTREFYDGLGRTTMSYTDAFEPGDVDKFYTFKQYDAQGRLWRESEPYLSSTVPDEASPDLIWNTYTYDTYGRVISITTPAPPGSGVSELTATMSYGFEDDIASNERLVFERVTDPEGNTYTTYYNSFGEEVKVVDQIGATITTSRANSGSVGTTLTITDAENNASIVEYDNLGRKRKVIDSNSGTWLYTYDKANNLTAQTDPAGNTTTFTYDDYNRLVGKNTGTETVSYSYDDSSTGMGRMVSIGDSSGTTTYAYDTYGRTIKIAKAVTPPAEDVLSGVSFNATIQMSYDSMDRSVDTTYPDGTIVKNIYAANGALQEVRMQQPRRQTGWSTMVTYQGPFDMQTDSPYLRRTTGNGVDTDIFFDKKSFMPTALKTTKSGAPTPYQDLIYDYDKLGNIKKITDALNTNATQTFGYDAIGRLTEATSGLYGSLTYEYSIGGNLTKKGATNLTYKSGCSVSDYAVCSDSTGNSYQYDTNGNMTRRGNTSGVYRDFVYDKEDRLIKVQGQTAGTTSYFGYNAGGQRTTKVSPNGTVTYYIGGIYEVMFTTDGNQMHTKYVYGAEGDLVAQHSDPNITLDDLNQVSLLASAGLLDFDNPEALADSLYAAMFAAWHNAQSSVDNYLATHQTPVLLWLFVLFAFGLLVVYLKNNYAVIFSSMRGNHPVQVEYTNSRRKGLAEISTVLLIAFSSLFVFNCFNAPTAGEGVPGSAYDPTGAPVITADLAKYNDTEANGRPIAGLLYFHPNHLGSTALLTNDAGDLITEIHYKPYGEIIRDPAASNGPDTIRYKYTGQEEDVETSLMYYNARYYDPGIGRFITQDNIVDEGAGTQGFNRYMYVGGNPINYRDPSGNFIEWLIIGALVIGAIVGGTHGQVFSAEAWNNFDVGGAVIGALAGVAAVATGGAAVAALGLAGGTAAVVGGLIGGAVGGFFNGAASTWNSGGSFGEGLINGFAGAIMGGGIGAITAGITYGLGDAFATTSQEWVGGTPNNTRIGETYKWSNPVKVNSIGLENSGAIGGASGGMSSSFIANVNSGGSKAPTPGGQPSPPPGPAEDPWEDFLNFTDDALGFINEWAPGPASIYAGGIQAGLRWWRGDTSGALESLQNSIPGLKRFKRTLGAIYKYSKGWKTPAEWAGAEANAIFKYLSKQGGGKGAKSGQAGKLLNETARALENRAKDKNLIPEVQDELRKLAEQYRQRARGSNHK